MYLGPSRAANRHLGRVVAISGLMLYVAMMALAPIVSPGDETPLGKKNAEAFERLRVSYAADILPTLRAYCLDCHSTENREGELDLERFATLADVRREPSVWLRVAEMLDNGEMPPDSSEQPSQELRLELRTWVALYLDSEAIAGAGDPGPVILRRLSNDEYNYTIHDLTGIASLDPTNEFPVDGAAGEGFTNSGSAQAMSPALVQKYIDAAKKIADHVVLLPDGVRFSQHLSRRDRTDELLARIQQFYRRYCNSAESVEINMHGLRFESEQERGLIPVADYLDALIRNRAALREDKSQISQVARDSNLNEKYLRRLFEMFNAPDDESSVLLNDLRSRYRDAEADGADALASAIAEGQNALFKFNAIGHIGREGGPASWMQPVTPIITSQRLELDLAGDGNRPATKDADPDIRVYLASDDLGDGNDQDFVVFKNPRIEFPDTDTPPIALRDLLARRHQIEQTISRELPRFADYLEAIRGELVRSRDGADARAPDHWKALAKDLDLNRHLLANWMELLDPGAQPDLDVRGHFTRKATRIHGYPAINGWQGDEALGLTTNQSDEAIAFSTLTVPARGVVVHPSPSREVAIVWRSPIHGKIEIDGLVADADDKCGNGATWRVEHLSRSGMEPCAGGVIDNGGQQQFRSDGAINVAIGDTLALVVGPRDSNHVCDTTHVQWNLRETGGDQRSWDLAEEIVDRVLESNPLADSQGNADTWHFVVLGEVPDKEAVIPSGSAMAKWRSAVLGAQPEEEIQIALQELTEVLHSRDVTALGEADRLLHRRVFDWLGPLDWWNGAADAASQVESGHGPKSLSFGKHPRGMAVGANDLCIQAPEVIAFDVPKRIAENARFVTTGRLHESTGEEGSVMLRLSTMPPSTDNTHYGEPIVVSEGSDAATQIENSMSEFRDLFPAAICYMRIVPVDEVVTLTLFHREDDYMRQLMLDDAEAAELDRLWDELIYVSHEPLQKVVALEQLREFATQDRPDLVTAFAPLEAPVAKRADQFRQRLIETQSVHVDAILEMADSAWRRPLSDTEKESLRGFYQSLRASDIPHENAIRLTVARVLASPAFLYRREKPAPGSEPAPVSGAELATRLSYFLWSSLPDDELRRAGDAGTLTSQSELVSQARRMLKDDRVRRLAIQFACQWLHVRGFDENLEKNETLYPEFVALRKDMYEETVRFFEAMFREDGSILELIDADHTFLNDRLAGHYGIVGVEGSHWRRVNGVRDKYRGGVLTMATVLASQSGVSRTSPILRGNWVYETLLGERLPRPPPTVPTLPESVPSGLTARQLIEQHSSVPECAKCHERIDPFGFALERFDTIGRLRENEVDVATRLPDGQTIQGAEGLRQYLLQVRRDDVVRQFCRKLLGYALGREIEISDRPLLEKMEQELVDRNYRFSAAVETIVTSRQFREIRGEARHP